MPAPKEPRPQLPDPAPGDIAAIQETLLAWFAEHARDLPWRHTRDPYRVLVSEVMLQQIQVVRAIPFYLAFLERFPTVEALAAAPIADVIRVWGDLGRYKRLVNLHRTARHIVEDLGGRFPQDPAELRRLPGVGPYTAGAVACFAFERDAAFADTNMARVLHRLFVGPDVPDPAATAGQLLRLAELAVPPGRAWAWNQALMEFGALHCTARRPKCAPCPLREHCRAAPTIAERLAALPRAPKGSTVPPEGSYRRYRGRVLAALRDLPPEPDAAIDLQTLGPKVRDDFADGDVPWLYGVVRSLTTDGLAAIAEERPTYDAGPHPAPEPDAATLRVRLP